MSNRRKHSSKRTCLPACKWNETDSTCTYKRTLADGTVKYKLCGSSAKTYVSDLTSIVKPIQPEVSMVQGAEDSYKKYETSKKCTSPCKWQDDMCTYRRKESDGTYKYKLCGASSTAYVKTLADLKQRYLRKAQPVVVVPSIAPSLVPLVQPSQPIVRPIQQQTVQIQTAPKVVVTTFETNVPLLTVIEQQPQSIAASTTPAFTNIIETASTTASETIENTLTNKVADAIVVSSLQHENEAISTNQKIDEKAEAVKSIIDEKTTELIKMIDQQIQGQSNPETIQKLETVKDSIVTVNEQINQQVDANEIVRLSEATVDKLNQQLDTMQSIDIGIDAAKSKYTSEDIEQSKEVVAEVINEIDENIKQEKTVQEEVLKEAENNGSLIERAKQAIHDYVNSTLVNMGDFVANFNSKFDDFTQVKEEEIREEEQTIDNVRTVFNELVEEKFLAINEDKAQQLIELYNDLFTPLFNQLSDAAKLKFKPSSKLFDRNKNNFKLLLQTYYILIRLIQVLEQDANVFDERKQYIIKQLSTAVNDLVEKSSQVEAVASLESYVEDEIYNIRVQISKQIKFLKVQQALQNNIYMEPEAKDYLLAHFDQLLHDLINILPASTLRDQSKLNTYIDWLKEKYIDWGEKIRETINALNNEEVNQRKDELFLSVCNFIQRTAALYIDQMQQQNKPINLNSINLERVVPGKIQEIIKDTTAPQIIKQEEVFITPSPATQSLKSLVQF